MEAITPEVPVGYARVLDLLRDDVDQIEIVFLDKADAERAHLRPVGSEPIGSGSDALVYGLGEDHVRKISKRDLRIYSWTLGRTQRLEHLLLWCDDGVNSDLFTKGIMEHRVLGLKGWRRNTYLIFAYHPPSGADMSRYWLCWFVYDMVRLQGDIVFRHIGSNLSAPLRLDRFVSAALGVLKQVQQLHSWGILHRDVGIQNVMVYKGALTVFDFGTSWRAGAKSSLKFTSMDGVFALAPEFNEDSSYQRATTASDVYMLFLTLFAFAFRIHDTRYFIIPKFIGAVLDDIRSVGLGDLAEIFAGALRKNPSERAELVELKGRLESLRGLSAEIPLQYVLLGRFRAQALSAKVSTQSAGAGAGAAPVVAEVVGVSEEVRDSAGSRGSADTGLTGYTYPPSGASPRDQLRTITSDVVSDSSGGSSSGTAVDNSVYLVQVHTDEESLPDPRSPDSVSSAASVPPHTQARSSLCCCLCWPFSGSRAGSNQHSLLVDESLEGYGT